jgi:hypothetical protein
VPQDGADDVEMRQQIEQQPHVAQQQKQRQSRGSLGSASESEDGVQRLSVLQRLGRNK